MKQERAWIIRVAVNACKDWKKSAWFRHRARLEDTLPLWVEPPQEGGLLELVQSLPRPNMVRWGKDTQDCQFLKNAVYWEWTAENVVEGGGSHGIF